MINEKVLKHAMIDKNIGVKELAKALNLSINTVSMWVNGNNLNQIDKFLDMIVFLDIDIKKLKK